MISSITRRAATEQDAAFLFELFQAVRVADFALVPMPPAQIDLLVRMQFHAQTVGYQTQYPDASHEIVLFEGRPAGRIWVHRDASSYVLVDISLAPAHQGRGIGAALVSGLIAEARAAGVPVRCTVATNNPGSLGFHQRLGFRIVAQDPTYYELECATAP